MPVINGKTSAESYVVNAPNGPSYYQTIPLLTVGDEIPLLQGNVSGFTTSTSQTYAFTGIPDGIGIYESQDNYFVFVGMIL